MADVLTIAGIPFDGWSTPQALPFGGKQGMVVHKLPGGSRCIDTLGPDEADMAWRGKFFSDTAFDDALAIDAIRQAGQVVPLMGCGQYRSVIVNAFLYDVRRFPNWVTYQISCTVYQNPALGILGAVIPTMDSLVLSDLALAASL